MNEPDPNSSLPGDDRWARDALTKLAFAAVAEQRRTRRWGIFFKLLFFAYLVLLAGAGLAGQI
jgi:protease-4